MKRKIYHVVKRSDDWQVRRPGARRATSCHATKRSAVAWAHERLSSGAHSAQLIIHGQDGRIQTEWTYGADPAWKRG